MHLAAFPSSDTPTPLLSLPLGAITTQICTKNKYTTTDMSSFFSHFAIFLLQHSFLTLTLCAQAKGLEEAVSIKVTYTPVLTHINDW